MDELKKLQLQTMFSNRMQLESEVKTLKTKTDNLENQLSIIDQQIINEMEKEDCKEFGIGAGLIGVIKTKKTCSIISEMKKNAIAFIKIHNAEIVKEDVNYMSLQGWFNKNQELLERAGDITTIGGDISNFIPWFNIKEVKEVKIKKS